MDQLPFDSGRFIKLCFASFKFEMPLESSYVPHVKNIEFKIGTSKVRVGAISNESFFLTTLIQTVEIFPHSAFHSCFQMDANIERRIWI